MFSNRFYQKPSIYQEKKLFSYELVKTQYGFSETGTFQPCDAVILDDGDPWEEWSFTVSNLGSNPQIGVSVDVGNGAFVQVKLINTNGDSDGCASPGDPASDSIVPAGSGTVVIQIFANAAGGSSGYQLDVNPQDCEVSNLQKSTSSCTTGGCIGV